MQASPDRAGASHLDAGMNLANATSKRRSLSSNDQERPARFPHALLAVAFNIL
jgi:hypothetical protein